MMRTSSKGMVLAALLSASVTCVQAAQGSQASDNDFWLVQTSIYTRHFSSDSEHNNRQNLIGLERNEASGLVYGGATFRNSFRQQSAYGYMGKRFESSDYPVYLKVTGGLIYGYRGEYRDKIPLNRFGIAPAIIPSVGAHFGPVSTEVVLLGVMATMVNVGIRF